LFSWDLDFNVPVQNSDLTSEESANEVKQMATENGSGQFDSSGGLAEDSTNGDGNTGNEQNIVEQESENRAEENQEEVVVRIILMRIPSLKKILRMQLRETGRSRM
jgi:hypothetical protein